MKYCKSYEIHKPNKNQTGSCVEFRLEKPTSDNSKGAIWIAGAEQIAPIGSNPTYDWPNKLNTKFGVKDINSFLSVLTGIVPKIILTHKTSQSDYATTIIFEKFLQEIEIDKNTKCTVPCFSLNIIRKYQDGQSSSIKIRIDYDIAIGLGILLRRGMEVLHNW
jgi:hypothetical protein